MVGVFNQAQTEKNRDTISNYSASTWLKSERPKHSIYPHKLDYCAKTKEELHCNPTTLNKEEQKEVEATIAKLTSELEMHHENAKKSHDYYTATKKRCKEEWTEIKSTEAKDMRTEQEEHVLELDLFPYPFQTLCICFLVFLVSLNHH